MILGITGTIGAGKGTVVDYLVSKKGFTHYSVREFLIEEIEKRGMPVHRDSMYEVANDIRTKQEPSYIIQVLYERALESGKNALIESVRGIGEAEFLKQKGVKILAVDADRRRRFERVTARGSVTDHIDFHTFVLQEEKELASTDPAGQNITAVMNMAEYRIQNDESLEELHTNIEAMFGSPTLLTQA